MNDPDRLLPLQTASCASLQLFGVIQLNAGVVFSCCRSRKSPLEDESRFAMCAESQSVPPWAGFVNEVAARPLAPAAPVSPSNHGNGKCLATYWSFACAPVKLVTPAGAGWSDVGVR